METEDSDLERSMAASRLVSLSNAMAAAALALWLGGCVVGMVNVLGPAYLTGLPGFVLLVVAAVVGQVGRARQKRLKPQ